MSQTPIVTLAPDGTGARELLPAASIGAQALSTEIDWPDDPAGPRIVVRMAPGSRGRLLLEHADDDAAEHFTNAVLDGSSYLFIFGYEPRGFAIRHFRIVEGQALAEPRGVRGKPLILGRAAAQSLRGAEGRVDLPPRHSHDSARCCPAGAGA